ncbi:MAG TPA: VanZ family protein [Gemmatimonadaceae bacterium]|nr:VanZ family protein [Gemmatimonadaceae bacterium]
MTPNYGQQQPNPSFCLVCGTFGGTDVLLNILLFIPFGLGLRLSGMRAWKALIIAAATSLAIEVLQVGFIVGRDASLGDLVSNSVGGLVGIGLATSWRAWLFPRAWLARRLALGGVVAWVAILAASAWAAQPSLPDLPYWGHWASLTGPGPLFPGKLIDVSVGNRRLPWGPLWNSRPYRHELFTDHAPFRAIVLPGVPVEGLAPITRITDLHRQLVILLGQEGRDLVFIMRTHASDLRLRDPVLRIANVFPDSASVAARSPSAPPDLLHIAGGYSGRAYWVSASAQGMERRRVLPLGPGLGWSYLIPFRYAAGKNADILTAVWLGALLFPVGYWGARAAAGDRRPMERRARRGGTMEMVALLILAVVAGLLVVPLLFAEPLPHSWQWLACGVGALLGWELGAQRVFVRAAT